ncbi:hypothetical protein FNV43_RR22297 [Rhamnella rubrinervis]|uniref:Uncharacterized protein n=1 Tax=Rhamnella rubrinervis TaxID=2594499 RepID=A0A8K0DWT6_9ROSA|nr:hypothetical protein FNV43_RR22297 [Rhamnella rubrinervis]
MATDDDHTENTNGDYTSVPIEDQDKRLANSIKAKLLTASPLSATCCIFRVPEVLRRFDKKAYEPDVVAIGPYHRKKPSLQPMEDVKKWYLHNLLSRMNMSMLSLIQGIKGFETRARECYQEPLDVDDEENEFMEIMIIDGCFLIELFRKETYSSLRSLDDPIFNMACMHQYLYHDLSLLENQLPWFVLQNLYYLTMPNEERNLSLSELVLKFFRAYFSLTISYETRPRFDIENLHILDLIRNVLLSSYPDTDQTESSSTNGDDKPKLIPCVTNLLEAGVKFRKGSPGMMNIEFENGIFVIPPLSIQETTEPMFRNLIAFEQCYHSCQDKITSYAILMDSLINTGRDMEHLVKHEIIDNWLSAEDASQFFNRLYFDTFVTKFYYSDLCKRVNGYYRTKWHKWRATLIRDYFTTPWTIISLVAAFILLVLTFLQTYYSIKQSYSSDDKQNPANSTRLL